jgi:chitinase domain-containing protein 1
VCWHELAEIVLQLLGSVAFIQIFEKKFMFAEDKEWTIKEVTTFLDTKVAPKDLGDDLKELNLLAWLLLYAYAL